VAVEKIFVSSVDKAHLSLALDSSIVNIFHGVSALKIPHETTLMTWECGRSTHWSEKIHCDASDNIRTSDDNGEVILST
jgi:hypothetical protein